MKLILMVLFTMPVISVFSQDIQFTVSVDNKTITVSPDDDNTNKVLVISKAQSGNNDFLTIHVKNEEIDKDWKRNFSIYDSVDRAITDLTLMKNGNYCIKLSKLNMLMQPQQDYSIYTTAIPTDPKKAALVKAARRFVCKIKIQ